jgi:hypothetical protein
LQREIDDLSTQKATLDRKPLQEFRSVLEFIKAHPKKQHHELRLRLRTIIGSMVEEIVINPWKLKSRRCNADVCVKLRNGEMCWRYNIADEIPDYVLEEMDEQHKDPSGKAPSFLVTPTESGFTTFVWPKQKGQKLLDAAATFPEPAMIAGSRAWKPSGEKKATANAKAKGKAASLEEKATAKSKPKSKKAKSKAAFLVAAKKTPASKAKKAKPSRKSKR